MLEAALKAARADLLTERRLAAGPGERVAPVSDVDALLALADGYLAHGRAVKPRADRYLVHAHLDTADAGKPRGESHLGPILPDALRRFLGCDASMRPVWETNGVPVSVGRSERIVPDRTRRLIEHRDQGCIVPGCGRRWQMDVHHITHWEDGGGTDTDNLCCLCRTHHRQHHLGELGIRGNADRPGGLVVTDRWGRVIEPTGALQPIDPDQIVDDAATDRGITTDAYPPRYCDPLDPANVHFSPNPVNTPARC